MKKKCYFPAAAGGKPILEQVNFPTTTSGQSNKKQTLNTANENRCPAAAGGISCSTSQELFLPDTTGENQETLSIYKPGKETLSLKKTQQNTFPVPTCTISSSVSQNLCVPANVGGRQNIQLQFKNISVPATAGGKHKTDQILTSSTRQFHQQTKSPTGTKSNNTSTVTESNNITEQEVPATIGGKNLSTNQKPLYSHNLQIMLQDKRRKVRLPSQEQTNSTAKKRKRTSQCPLPTCNVQTRKLKEHCGTHFPVILRENVFISYKEQHAQEEIFGALQLLASYILGASGSPEHLMSMLNNTNRHLLPDPHQSSVSDHLLSRMISLCHYCRWEIPQEFILNPLNSPATLLHWRVLICLISFLTTHQREYFRQWSLSNIPCVHSDICSQDHTESNEPLQFPDVESHCYNAPIPDIPQHVSHVLPQAIDSHFHLGRTRRKIWDVHSLATSEDIIHHTPPPGPKRPVNVIGGVEIYCDPSFYPPVPSSDSPFKVAVGIHPRHATSFSYTNFTSLQRLIQSRYVTALGEIGLDRTEHISTWCEQERILIEVLSLCTIR